MHALASLGHVVIHALATFGSLTVFTARAFFISVTPPWSLRRIGSQLLVVGYYSLPVVGMTALFTGAALAQQIFVGGSRFNASSTVPAVTVIAIVRELGPVLCGLMVAGRISSAMAAEIGAMRVSEQIDALSTLSVDPHRYLIAPRVIASTIALPFLTLIANVIGVMGGYLIGVYRLGFNAANYLDVTRQYLEWQDIQSSLVKAVIFGFIVAVMGCYYGFHSKGGAAGVGRATISAVVSAFIAILLVNLVITVIVFGQVT